MTPTTAARPDHPEPTTRALNARQAAILEAVVTEYIGTAEPVGSSHVANAPGVQVSSATVRSEMVALERDGYLVQPHTSAGRIPTDKGYRFFVDHLTQPGVLGPAQHEQVCAFFDQVHGEMEDMLDRATGLLVRADLLCRRGGGPSHETATIRSVQVVGLAPGAGPAGGGALRRRRREADHRARRRRQRRHAAPGRRRVDHPPHRSPRRPAGRPPSGDADVDRVVASAVPLRPHRGSMESDHVFVGGPARLAESFDAVETVRTVLGILEQQLVVVTLLRDVLNRGLSVAIGTEHGYEPLASCAVVVAPVSIDGHELGAVGLFGPTRMDYPRALAAAHVVGERLGERLGETGRGGAPRQRQGVTMAGTDG